MNVNESLWSVKLPNGDVRTGTFEQLDEAFRARHLAESVLVRAAGSATWVKLGDLMGSAPTRAPMPAQVAVGWQSPARVAASVVAPTIPSAAAPAPMGQQRTSAPPPPAAAPPHNPGNAGDRDVWQVKLSNGEVRSGTRQQLEDAFRAGHLGEGALVLASGAREWVTLGDVMGRGQPTPASVSPPALAAPQPESGPPAPAPSAPQSTAGDREVWQVTLTRPQLELALRDGYLDDDARVLAAGATEWVRLGTVLGRVQPTHAQEGPVERPGTADWEATPLLPPSSDPVAAPTVTLVSSPSPVPDAQAALPQQSEHDPEPVSGDIRAPAVEGLEQAFLSERFGE
jgi:hypothetical protein